MTSCALFVVVKGTPHCLYRWTCEALEEHVQSVGETAAWQEAADEWTDGVLVCELRMVDDGPGDWESGVRDCRLDAFNSRSASTEEWARFVSDEYVWDGEMM